jgi:hypothetical protein
MPHTDANHPTRIMTKMQPSPTGVRTLRASLLTLLLAMTPYTRAATIWDGPTMTFSETTTDPTLSTNQDRITDNVWITRGDTQGIFNAKTEIGFAHDFSPADTAWADGTLADYASLTYTNWNDWAKIMHGGPPNTVGVNAVAHLISDDIYISIKFTFWGGSGGLFTYQRTTVPGAVAPIPLTIAQIGNKAVLSWTNAAFSLQSATNVAGPYTMITNAVSPFTNSLAGAQTYFRLVH